MNEHEAARLTELLREIRFHCKNNPDTPLIPGWDSKRVLSFIPKKLVK